jgi:dTDP-glucose 4,6-dehydratase
MTTPRHPASVLVTGGAGFIGSAVVRMLLATTDVRVVNLDKLTYAACLASLGEAAHSDRYTFVEGDIACAETVDAVFGLHDPDVVMHLAAESHVDRSIDGPGAFIHTNVVGTYTLLQAARAQASRREKEGRSPSLFLHV